jgi:hypothetical protein
VVWWKIGRSANTFPAGEDGRLLRTGTTMADDEIKNLKKDISKTGYVSEMIAARIFGKAGWQVYDHLYFLDKDENKGREIDLSAIYTSTKGNSKKSLTVKLGLSVEVKKASSKPWVVFTSPLNSPLETIENLFDTSLIRLHIQEIWFPALYENHPVSKCKGFGRVSYQSFRGQENEDDNGVPNKRSGGSSITPNFGAFVSSFKAAIEIRDFFRLGNNQPLRDGDIRTYEVGIVHGLIVVDGKLYDAGVQDDRSFEIQDVPYIPYTFSYNSKEYGSKRLLIDIVTLEHLPHYLKTYQAWIEERATYCLGELS